MLFGAYRKADANDPDAYVASIAAVLSLYEADVVREVTDPRTGIQATEKFAAFLPNAGELKLYCDGVAAYRERMKNYAALPSPNMARVFLPPPPPAPGDRANMFVPADHYRYASLVDWTRTADPRDWKFGKSSDGRAGLWIRWDLWDDNRAGTKRLSTWSAPTLEELRKRYAKPHAQPDPDEPPPAEPPDELERVWE